METKPKRFGIVPEFLVENRLVRFGPESTLLDQIEMFSFDGADSGTNTDVLVSFLLVVAERLLKTFVERLFLYYFDITRGGWGGIELGVTVILLMCSLYAIVHILVSTVYTYVHKYYITIVLSGWRYAFQG
jgi:hypothetical protein